MTEGREMMLAKKATERGVHSSTRSTGSKGDWLDGLKPQGNFTVVSTLNMGSTVQYRIVGELSARAGAVETAPSLEDGYVWLMREQRATSVSVL
jgi:hypothetical protein